MEEQHTTELKPVEETPQSDEHVRRNQLISALSAFVVGAELNPLTNSAVRVALAAGLGITTKNPEAIGLFMLGATAVYEIPGTVAAAWLLNTERGGRLTVRANGIIQGIRHSISRRKIAPAPLQNINPVTAAATAMVLGPPALLAIKQTIDPTRTFQDNIRYGVPVAAAVSAAVSGESFLVASGIIHAQPETIAAAVVGFAGIVAAVRYGLHQLRGSGPSEQPATIDTAEAE